LNGFVEILVQFITHVGLRPKLSHRAQRPQSFKYTFVEQQQGADPTSKLKAGPD